MVFFVPCALLSVTYCLFVPLAHLSVSYGFFVPHAHESINYMVFELCLMEQSYLCQLELSLSDVSGYFSGGGSCVRLTTTR